MLALLTRVSLQLLSKYSTLFICVHNAYSLQCTMEEVILVQQDSFSSQGSIMFNFGSEIIIKRRVYTGGSTFATTQTQR